MTASPACRRGSHRSRTSSASFNPIPSRTAIAGQAPKLPRYVTESGYADIDEDHVSPPARISAALGRVLRPVARAVFPPLAPVPLALYQCTAWTRA